MKRSDEMTTTAIRPHNLTPAATWGSAGAAYDRISETIADSIEHCVVRLDPQPGERILDVATGTGWAARRVAARGAAAVGVDIGAELIAAAQEIAAAAGQTIDFRVGDAELLPFENQSFDAAISTFGVMFVRDPEAAAAELARVCRCGGRLALTTWASNGTLADYFQVMRPYMPPPPAPPPPSPFAWGNTERLRELLGAAFELRFETGTSFMRVPSAEAAWELFVATYGPTKTLVANLDPERRESLRRDVTSYFDQFRTELGISWPREYLVTIGVRR
jgi:SAM-dependent methyltransferase